jgi:hypothetical protein
MLRHVPSLPGSEGHQDAGKRTYLLSCLIRQNDTQGSKHVPLHCDEAVDEVDLNHTCSKG